MWCGAWVGLLVLWLGTAPVRAQTIAFNDLEGTIIEAEIVYSRTFRRDSRVLSNENHTLFKLAIGPGDTIDQSFTVKIVGRDGRQINSRTTNMAFTLGKPQDARIGTIVWIFDGGALTRLQTLVSGGRRMTIAFARDGDGLKCSLNAAFAREEGIGEIRTDSVVGPGTIEWLDVKQKSTSCRVLKR